MFFYLLLHKDKLCPLKGFVRGIFTLAYSTFAALHFCQLSFYYPSFDNINEKTQKIINELNNEINIYKEQDNKTKEEITKLNEEINKKKKK